VIIRPETPGDYPAVAGVNVAAFDEENEARLIALIRQSDLYVPELSLVAVEDDLVVGHVMFSYVTLETAAGPVRIFDLAPLAVHPHHQGRGVGTALTEHGLGLIERRGEPLVLVEGIPAYYPRFGFVRASLHGITPPSPRIPDDAFMVKLLPGYHPGLRGPVRYPAAFYQADAVGPPGAGRQGPPDRHAP
jgi:putative acetyltransferase